MVALRKPVVPPFWQMTRAQRYATLALGAAAFGGIVYSLRNRWIRRFPRLGEPECTVVEPTQGEVAGLRYLERVTPGADPEGALPMVVMFHSRGSRPEAFANFHHNLRGPARVIFPQGPERLGSAWSWFGLPAATREQAQLTDQMEDTGLVVANFLADIVRCRPTIGAPVVTGTSQGGSMSYLMASSYPNLVRGAVALLGWLPEELWDADMAQTVGLHATEDTTVPYLRTAGYAETMQAEGAPMTFLSYPGGHSVSRDMSREWARSVNRMLGYA